MELLLENKRNAMTECLKEIKDSNMPVVLFGAGNCGIAYLQIMNKVGIKVLCFCDDDEAKIGGNISNIAVVALEAACQIIEPFVLLISSYGPSKLLGRVKAVGLENKLILTDFYLYENGLDYYKYYQDKYNRLRKVFDLLEDGKSKHVMKNILNYKISRDFSLIREINEGEDIQYFDKDIVKLSNDEVFIDLGAYRGDTIEKFMQHTGTYKKIFAFEPDNSTFELLKKNTVGNRNIIYFNLGAFSQKDTLRFTSEGFSTSYINEQGELLINVDAVDNLIDEAVTFLKADIEGAEIDALYGARKLIQKYKPKIAICVYHKKDDIFMIPEILSKFNPNYKFYLRQYSEIPIETVLYAIDEV